MLSRSCSIAAVVAVATPAVADDAASTPAPAPAPPPPTDAFPYRRGALMVDGGLIVGAPAALPTGLSTGVAAGVARGRGWLVLGGRLAWSGATESSMTWTVAHDEVRLRATAMARHVAGRGELGLRAGAGATLVHEHRVRNQGERAGLEGDELETRATVVAPAAELEASVGVQIMGGWGLRIGAGPSVAWLDGEARTAWTSTMGIEWSR